MDNRSLAVAALFWFTEATKVVAAKTCRSGEDVSERDRCRYLPMSARGLMAMRVMHCFAAKLRTVFRWMLAARGHTPMVALAIVETMIDVSIEMLRSVVPRPRTDEPTTDEPFRAIVAVRSAVVRRDFVVSVRANRGRPNTD